MKAFTAGAFPIVCIALFIALIGSGCVEDYEGDTVKYVDPNDNRNYILFDNDDETFLINTTKFVASGDFKEIASSGIYSLRYADYNVGKTLKIVEDGIEIDNGVIWYKE